LIESNQPIVYAQEETPTEVLIEVRISWTLDRILEEIDNTAIQYGVSASEMRRVIKCESNFDPTIQSQHILSYGREMSFGLVQIHIPAHPHVTIEQALDPAFAIDFMAKAFSQGKHSMWTCY